MTRRPLKLEAPWDWIDENIMPRLNTDEAVIGVSGMSFEEALDHHAAHMMVLSGGKSYTAAWLVIDAARDPVAAVRREVESGTIKGEERRYCEEHEALVGAIPNLCNVANWVIDGGGSPTDCRINDALVVSDGGSET